MVAISNSVIVMHFQLLGEPGAGGSSTVSLVGAVKKWQKSEPKKALETWKKLSDANSALEVRLNMLSTMAKGHWDSYRSIIDKCSLLKSEKVIQKLLRQVATMHAEFMV